LHRNRSQTQLHPDIQHDAANPTKPHTAFGAIVAALRIRRDADLGPFTIQSCDNLQGNGAGLNGEFVLNDATLQDDHAMDMLFGLLGNNVFVKQSSALMPDMRIGALATTLEI